MRMRLIDADELLEATDSDITKCSYNKTISRFDVITCPTIDAVNCPLKSIEGLIEKMKENCNYDNKDKLSDYSIDLDEVIDIIKEYCEVSANAESEE